MPDYTKAKLYALRSRLTDDIYIGSTCSPLSKRLWGHRKHYRMYGNKKYHYLTSFEILKHPDHYIELLRAVPCATKEELMKLEGDEIRATACVNKRIEGRTNKQYYEDNKERLLETAKEYYQNNK